MTVIEDSTPLQQNHLPDEIIDREREREQLEKAPTGQNLHIHGPRGTGKTHLVKKYLEDLDGKACYISCLEHDTQYKILQQLVSQLTHDSIQTGHHTSELQRKVEEHTDVLDFTVVLDELDFLLLNDGDDLLYFLSRLNNPPKIITITANTEELKQQIEPRTYSSLHPRRIQFEPYTGPQIYEILADRASKSLKERSLHRNAATYIASSTQNAELALTWLRTAVQHADEAVTEELVQEIREDAYNLHIEKHLEKLSQHHRNLYQAIEELSKEKGPVVNAGSIYQRYQKITEERGREPLSNRRTSDYLKQLEELNLIKTEYHYGGDKGKAREIRLSNQHKSRTNEPTTSISSRSGTEAKEN
jgi:cell division control protein 6